MAGCTDVKTSRVIKYSNDAMSLLPHLVLPCQTAIMDAICHIMMISGADNAMGPEFSLGFSHYFL